MADIELKNFDSPDEVRPFKGKGQADVVVVGAALSVAGYSSQDGGGLRTSSR